MIVTKLKNRYGNPGNGVFLLILYFALHLGGQVLAKFAAGEEPFLNLYTLGSYCCLLFRGFIWVFILERMKLLAAYPLNALSYVLILPLAVLLFSESVPPVRLMSTLLITAGVALLLLGEKTIAKEKR